MDERAQEQVTRTFISRLFTFETLSTCAVGLVVGTWAWANLNGSVQASNDLAAASVQRSEVAVAKAEEIGKDVASIKTDIAVMKNSLGSAERRDEEQTSELREQREDIKKILEILRSDHR